MGEVEVEKNSDHNFCDDNNIYSWLCGLDQKQAVDAGKYYDCKNSTSH